MAFHPLDTVKTVLQRGGASGTAAMRVRALGAAGLYRGVLPAAFSMMPACAVRMGAYEVLKSTLLQHAPSEVVRAESDARLESQLHAPAGSARARASRSRLSRSPTRVSPWHES